MLCTFVIIRTSDSRHYMVTRDLEMFILSAPKYQVGKYFEKKVEATNYMWALCSFCNEFCFQ